ncbi:hypothetical protein DFH27DRAFT_341322 [Peziza echinospora]|nr:hypothetical protein DFH27DRAFT_341322 [Peziza echinospora]
MQAAKEVVHNFMKPSHYDSAMGTPGRESYSTGTTRTTSRAGSSDRYLDSNATRGKTTTKTTGGTKISGAQGGLTGVNSQLGGDSRYDSSRAAAAAADTTTGGQPTSHHKHTTVDGSDASQFVGNRKSDTEVREIVNPAVTKEVVLEENREEKTTAIDRELHQDHYQTRVQPVVDKKILSEEHMHRAAPVEYRERKHSKESEADIKRALEEERSRFQSTREVLPTQHVTEDAGTVVGEHHHHHVYETVQPVIEREVIQPTVTHTTIPVHEHIEKDPSFHPKTIQPVMTMGDFVRAGGSTEGRPERMDIFEGEPQVLENGGADQTHPNAWDARGNHVNAGGATTRSAASKAAGIASETGVSSHTGPQTTTTTTKHVEIPSGTNTKSDTSNMTGSNTRSGDLHQKNSGSGLDNTSNPHNATEKTHTSKNTSSGLDSGNLHNSSNRDLGNTSSGLDSGKLHNTSNKDLENTPNVQQNTGNRGLDSTTRDL